MAVRALTNLDDAPSRYQDEVRSAAARALRAGARRPMQYIGMGMTSVVFCDSRGRAYKVGRRLTSANRRLLSDEAEWLRIANTVPGAREHVARLYHFHRALNVIERECIRGQDRRAMYHAPRLSRAELHERIGRAMKRYGWSAPEFKDDSYVYSRGRGWVLVDASLAIRVGQQLITRAAEVLRGVRFYDQSPSDLAWEIRMEAGKTIEPAYAEALSERLLRLPDAERRTENGEARDSSKRRRRSRPAHARARR